MKLRITPDTTVGALLEAYPEAEAILIDLAPAFAKLRNPLVRRTVAKVATLDHAAKISGVSLHDMIQRLRAFAGQAQAETPLVTAVEDCGDKPGWVVQGRIVEVIDATAMLDRGVHPIAKVRSAVSALRPGEIVLLRAPFRPEPLLETMRCAGAQFYCTRQGENHIAYFAHTT